MKAFNKKNKLRTTIYISEDSLEILDKIIGSGNRSMVLNELVDAFNKKHKHRIDQQSKERKK